MEMKRTNTTGETIRLYTLQQAERVLQNKKRHARRKAINNFLTRHRKLYRQKLTGLCCILASLIVWKISNLIQVPELGICSVAFVIMGLPLLTIGKNVLN